MILSDYNIFNVLSASWFFRFLENDVFLMCHKKIDVKIGLYETPVMYPVINFCDV